MEKRGTLVHCWWECKLFHPLWKTVPEKIKNRTSTWPSNFTSGYIPKVKKKKALIWRDICTPIFIAALFRRAKIWNQPKVPIKRWIDKENGEYYSAMKKWNPAICDNMDGPRGYYAKGNKSDKEKYFMISFICDILKIKTHQT